MSSVSAASAATTAATAAIINPTINETLMAHTVRAAAAFLAAATATNRAAKAAPPVVTATYAPKFDPSLPFALPPTLIATNVKPAVVEATYATMFDPRLPVALPPTLIATPPPRLAAAAPVVAISAPDTPIRRLSHKASFLAKEGNTEEMWRQKQANKVVKSQETRKRKLEDAKEAQEAQEAQEAKETKEATSEANCRRLKVQLEDAQRVLQLITQSRSDNGTLEDIDTILNLADEFAEEEEEDDAVSHEALFGEEIELLD